MIRRSCLFILLVGLSTQSVWAQGMVYPYRWVFVARSLRADRDVEEIREIARVASEHGLNGLVLSSGLDRLQLQPPDFVERVKKVKEICDQYHIELIPQVFSVGYGGSVLGFDKNMAEGIPADNALFVVRYGAARLEPDPPVAFVNGGLEDYVENKLKGFQLQEQPGTVTFADRGIFHERKTSLRFENFTANPYGHGRLMQEIPVSPHREYRVTCWVKTDSLEPAAGFHINVLGTDGRPLAPTDFSVPSTTDWHKLSMGFNSLSYEKVRVYGGIWGGKSGKFWLDDFHIQEVGLTNVLRRPGTPITVRKDATALTYEEGRDYAPVSDSQLNFRFDHDGPAIKILPAGRIKDGDRLRVDYFHGMAVNNGQVTVCMSEPKLYTIWREQAHRLHELLAPKKFLLSMDEIRAGGSDLACKRRKMTMGQILGDCFTQEFQILRELNPQAEVFTWSDMLDPNHNAHGNYYLVDGDYTGSWQYVPHDLRIVCWYYKMRKESLSFFSGLGFKTLAGAYYDGDTLENPKGWLEALDGTPGAFGIMYTTWQNKYALLAPFGDLVSNRGGAKAP